ncbi:hypothetical protein [Ascidiimonas aurantiaca]|uniref:hypothetical protein n=1 Tax=Ascidiimonas aurantiaca TaxID=1685432 RepID=UPI0030EF5E51
MPKYYVNQTAQPNGDHEVHKEGCFWLSLVMSKTYLGEHLNCKQALLKAKKTYTHANGCKKCSNECHTS